MKLSAAFKENLRISVDSVRSNKVRAALTILIIAFGIMALVGILTAIDAIRSSLNSNFSNLGANTFKIESFQVKMKMGEHRERIEYKDITYTEATRFKEDYPIPSLISISAFLTRNSTIKHGSVKTNPNVPVMGIDDSYFAVSGYTLNDGRNFTAAEVQRGDNVIVIGSEIVKTIFKEEKEVIGKSVTMGGHRFRVVGVLKSKGSSFGSRGDLMCFVTINKARQINQSSQLSFTINIMPSENAMLDVAIGEAEGLFRIIRKLKLSESNNFEIMKSDMLVNMLMDNIKYITIAATLIGIITLLGAAIGLMNILLVSVAEKTREIGTRKALGANSATIKQQFLFEAIVICQLGGILGIILGIIIGNLVAVMIDGPFVVPWLWISGGIVVCFIVGISAGIIPAIKAAKLDPIEALRYE
ncbi:MAG: ABC transporter [Bacteroidetes bacterium HGW-Bacteroidetes-21]|nr:MAG: ABC transporter [Bacteroidetes bacterium HGW-Bacteroidetes-21]